MGREIKAMVFLMAPLADLVKILLAKYFFFLRYFCFGLLILKKYATSVTVLVSVELKMQIYKGEKLYIQLTRRAPRE